MSLPKTDAARQLNKIRRDYDEKRDEICAREAARLGCESWEAIETIRRGSNADESMARIDAELATWCVARGYTHDRVRSWHIVRNVLGLGECRPAARPSLSDVARKLQLDALAESVTWDHKATERLAMALAEQLARPSLPGFVSRASETTEPPDSSGD